MIIYTRARETTEAIEKMYVTMRHLFYRGFYKPAGVSGASLRNLLITIAPEIYGSMAVPHKCELDGLLYVLDRLPEGIEETPFVHLTSNEGLEKGNFQKIYPKKRRRVCYRVDAYQMNIEVLLGRSEIYDILTHLTFLYIEADKIRSTAYPEDNNGTPTRIWQEIEKVALEGDMLSREEKEVGLIHLASVLGRTFEECLAAYHKFSSPEMPDRLFRIVYYLGKVAQEDSKQFREREIFFSSVLRERIGHHHFGERWAIAVKEKLVALNLHEKPIHIISANMHSVKNLLFSHHINPDVNTVGDFGLYEEISNSPNLQKKILDIAQEEGLVQFADESGSNIDVQIFDLENLNLTGTGFTLNNTAKNSVLLVFDYAFGEQAFEVMDELLKPIALEDKTVRLNISSINIMGKAGILEGGKGDIMLPTAHIFEGTADNYPFENDLSIQDFESYDVPVYEGAMITVLGTSLQNKEILRYFKETSWKAIGLEMEGAHYQKAIQVASKIRGHISPELKLRYAYYASDNPLETGSTLSSGGLGIIGVKPTYLITKIILEKIFDESENSK